MPTCCLLASTWRPRVCTTITCHAHSFGVSMCFQSRTRRGQPPTTACSRQRQDTRRQRKGAEEDGSSSRLGKDPIVRMDTRRTKTVQRRGLKQRAGGGRRDDEVSQRNTITAMTCTGSIYLLCMDASPSRKKSTNQRRNLPTLVKRREYGCQ